MNFAHNYNLKIAPQWKKGYFDYKLFQTLLSSLKILSKHKDQVNFNYADIIKDYAIVNIKNYFELNFQKVDKFFEYTLYK